VPSELVGAWRRSGLLVAGRRIVDYCDVLWLQTDDWYADIRLRIARAPIVAPDGVPAWLYQELSFAGTASWAAPVITWDHLIDSRPDPEIDRNPLSWEDGVVVERGTTRLDRAEVAYTEEWLRMTDDDVTRAVRHGEGFARVEVGRFAIEIRDERPSGRFTSTRYQRPHGGDDWAEVGTVTA
jgi:hypothetical protein